MLSSVEEFGIDARNFFRYQGVITSIIAIGFDINDIGDTVHLSVTQRIIALQQNGFRTNFRKIDMHIAFHVDHRANLQQIEYTTAAGSLDFHSKFDFDWAAHRLLSEA